jgi:hypothetical protein
MSFRGGAEKGETQCFHFRMFSGTNAWVDGEEDAISLWNVSCQVVTDEMREAIRNGRQGFVGRLLLLPSAVPSVTPGV